MGEGGCVKIKDERREFGKLRKLWMSMCASAYRAVNITNSTFKLGDTGWTTCDLMRVQNEFFSKYPYSDEMWRVEMLKQTYGEMKVSA